MKRGEGVLVCWRKLLYPDKAFLPKLAMGKKFAEILSEDIRKFKSTK
jgi:hypothetical protein